MSRPTDVDETGRAGMVDVSEKETTARIATAAGHPSCSAATLEQVRSGTTPKGAVVAAAELAATMAAKRPTELIPLCHLLPLGKIEVGIEIDDGLPGFRVSSEVRTNSVMGVEMEALAAVSAVDRLIVIGGIEVISKSGGKSGDWKK